jgi:adsorption protein B
MLLRDRRGPIAALLLIAGYAAGLLWSQLWLAESLGAPVQARMGDGLVVVLKINAGLLAWRVLMRASFTTSAYGWRQGLLSVPRLLVANLIAILAALRALSLHLSGGDKNWDKTHHIFPSELAR